MFSVAMALVVLLGAVAISQAVARSERTSVEKLTENTAAGDRDYFPFPKKSDGDKMLVSFQGKKWFRADADTAKEHDSEMIRLGRDDSGRYEVYRWIKEKPDNARYYLKFDSERFLPIESK